MSSSLLWWKIILRNMVLRSFTWPDPTLLPQEDFKGHNFDMVSYPNGSIDFIET